MSLFFVASKGRKFQKIVKSSLNGRSKNSYFLRELKNFNGISGGNVTYDIKSDKNTKLDILFSQHIF